MIRFSIPGLLLGALALSLHSCRSSEEVVTPLDRGTRPEIVKPRPWTHESSDIPVDQRIHFGHFDNGLRWAWAENPEPEHRVYLRLHVDVGSLAEEEHERGLAHFLEHMAFNGSENFEAGTLIEWFQKHGMSFGADTNAHTSFSETVYKLDLPSSDEESLREGLTVLRDFADGLLLEEAEVEAEKGVIDGEERERDSAAMRVGKKQLEIAFAGTRIGERLPIGLPEVRADFTAETVRAFYERWYRPEHMTLVAVGDLGGYDPEPLFAQFFASMPVPGAPLLHEPGPGSAQRYDHAFAIFEDEIPSLSIGIERLKPWQQEPVTVAEWLEDLPIGYARSMVNLRFVELAKEESAPFLTAKLQSASIVKVFDGESLSIECPPENWREAMNFCEQELRRALEFGFQDAELAELRANALRSLDEAVDREATAHSRGLLRGIMTAAEEPAVPTNAETRRSILRPGIEALTVEACLRALKQAWSEGELSLTASGNLDLGDNTGEQLRDVFESSTRVAVEAAEAIEELNFAYASTPQNPGEIVSREHVEDLDFTTVSFANGVSVNVKRTDFRKKQILVAANIGEGRLTLEPERDVLNWVGKRVFTSGGLEAHSIDDLRRLTAGKQVGANFVISPDAFQLSGSTTAEDLLMQCELMCAQLESSGWREDGLIQMRRQLPLMFESMKHEPSGPMFLEFYPALFSNDPRFGVPTEEQAAAVEMDQIREWLEPQLKRDAMEVSFVGDLDLDQVIEIAARTFGKLPRRLDWRRLEERRVVPTPKTGLRQTHEIETEVPTSLVLLAFPVPDGIDPQVRRSFTALVSIVNDRLRLEVRERLGAAYSPRASAKLSTTHPGVGLLLIQASADPETVDTLVEACLEVARSLATDGITDEEVDRLREPILNKMRDAKRANSYWMGVLSRSQRDANHLEEVRTADAFFAAYSAADLIPLAAEYLKPERASILVVNPKK